MNFTCENFWAEPIVEVLVLAPVAALLLLPQDRLVTIPDNNEVVLILEPVAALLLLLLPQDRLVPIPDNNEVVLLLKLTAVLLLPKRKPLAFPDKKLISFGG